VYHWVQGTTDSEACFALILSLIEPELLAGGECVPVAVLRKAMLSAIATLRGFLADAGVVEGASTVLSGAGHEWHVVTASASKGGATHHQYKRVVLDEGGE